MSWTGRAAKREGRDRWRWRSCRFSLVEVTGDMAALDRQRCRARGLALRKGARTAGMKRASRRQVGEARHGPVDLRQTVRPRADPRDGLHQPKRVGVVRIA